MDRKNSQLFASASAAVLALLLASCASGSSSAVPGGGLGGPTLPPSSPPASGSSAATFQTGEYALSWALEAVHAAEAYAGGFTGKGVNIGIVDFNFDLGSTEIRYHADSRDKNQTYLDMYKEMVGGAEERPHGAAVAAVAASLKNDAGIHGIAFDARVFAVDYFSGVNQTLVNGQQVQYVYSDPWTFLYRQGVRVMNASWGYDEEDVISSGAPGMARPRAVEFFTAPHPDIGRYIVEDKWMAIHVGALLVVAAGNDGDPEPALDILDTLAMITDRKQLDGPGALIIAGATNSSGVIADFSDRAGSTMMQNGVQISPRDHYMVAPGEAIAVPWEGAMASLDGTSFAAPIISGAAAMVLQRWPSLTSRQVADILFASATDLGAPGVDDIYGHGLLNIDAALQPVGVTTMAVATGTGASLPQTGLVLGSAFGDASGFTANLTSVVLFDGFGRDFTTDLSRVTQSAPGFSLQHALEQKRAWNSTAVTIGEHAALAFHIQNADPVSPRAGLDFGESGQAELGTTVLHFGPHGESQPLTAFRFAGATEDFTWTAGYGLSLGDALSSESVFSSASLTRPFATLLDAPSGFAAFTAPLSADTTITFGAASARDPALAGVNPALMDSASANSAVARLTHRGTLAAFAFEFAGLFEEGTVLGTRSSGGLSLGNGAATLSIGGSAEAPLAAGWSFKAAALAAFTDTRPASGSLFAEVGTIRSSSFGVGFAREALFREGDVLSFSFGQKLRVDDAPATLVAGTFYDPASLTATMTTTYTSLVPSGRERSFEAGYRAAFGAWSFDANLAYAIEAGHVAGATETRALLFLSRRF